MNQSKQARLECREGQGAEGGFGADEARGKGTEVRQTFLRDFFSLFLDQSSGQNQNLSLVMKW